MANTDCISRLVGDWAILPGVADRLPVTDRGLALCLQGDVALFVDRAPDSARLLYDQAVKISPNIPDGHFRLACLQLFPDESTLFDGCGHLPASISQLSLSTLKTALESLKCIAFPETDSFYRSQNGSTTRPYRWILLIEALALRALLTEKFGNLTESYTMYSELWKYVVAPNFEMTASISTPVVDVAAAETDSKLYERGQLAAKIRARRICNVTVAIIIGKCRLKLRLGHHAAFVNTFRKYCTNSVLSAPAVRQGLFQRCADLLVFYHLPLYAVYSTDKSGKSESIIRTPFEEASLLVGLVLDPGQPSEPAPECLAGCRRTMRLILASCDRFGSIADLYRDDLAVDLSNHYLWYIRALALYASEHFTEAFLCVKLSLELSPRHACRLLFAAKLALNHLSNASQAVQFSISARNLCDTDHFLRAVCEFAIASSSERHAYEVETFSKRKVIQQQAIDASVIASQAQPRNQKVVFAAAAIQADIREVDMALRLVKYSLTLNSTHHPSWQLLALLISSQKKYDEAVEACNMAMAECYPTVTSELMFIKARILSARISSEVLAPAELSAIIARCLATFRDMLPRVFSPEQIANVNIDQFSCPTLLRSASCSDDPPNVAQVGLSVNARQKCFRFYSSMCLKQDDPDALKYRTLLALAELYEQIARLLNLPDFLLHAFNFVEYACDLGASSWLPDIYATMARLYKSSGDLPLAVSYVESALAFDGNHTDSLTLMGAINHKMDRAVIAHENLINALRIDSTLHNSWLEMGAVLKGQGKYEAASDAILTSLELERTAPAESFYTIRRTI